jgi:deoxyribonuclease V
VSIRNEIPANLRDAKALQHRLAGRIKAEDDFGEVRVVVGLDAAYPEGRRARAAAAAFTFPELEAVDFAVIEAEPPFPYRPGMFCFREGPLVLRALDRLDLRADVVLADGHGLMHPRRMGLACWIGLAADRPTVGVAKNRLAGLDAIPGDRRGNAAGIHQDGEAVGYVLRVQAGVRPVYVSPGHRIGMDSALELALACSPRYRTPEPLRRAHALAVRGEAA